MAANCLSSFDVATATPQESPQFSLIQLHPVLHEKMRKSYNIKTKGSKLVHCPTYK